MTPQKPAWLRVFIALSLSALWSCDMPVSSHCQTRTYLVDADGDGFGDDRRPVEVCGGRPGVVLPGGDCDDTEASRSPDAVEVCDGIDDDCDGQLDEDTPTLARRYADIDLDGFGDAEAFMVSCRPIRGYVDNSEDCDDTDGSVFPTADELCDGLDNDCDGQIDETLASQPWFVDADGDGVGSEALQVESCRPPEGFVAEAGDCDDHDPERSPARLEVCNDGIDNDCDGVAGRCEWRGRYALADEANVLLPDRASGRFGWAMDCRGDTNHDGFDDIIVGQPQVTNTDTSYGRVFFLRGPLQGRTSAAQRGSWFIPPLGRFHSVGGSVAFVQDIDGDQGAEAILGSLNTFHQGVYLIASPFPARHIVEFAALIGEFNTTDRIDFGVVVTSLGDINADGRGDFAALSRTDNTNRTPQEPIIYIFEGNAAHVYSLPEAPQLLGPLSEDSAGLSLASTPDITGDGQPDLFVGAPKSDLGGELSGLVYVVASPFGTSARQELTEAGPLLVGHEASAQAGFSVSDAGDVNGDGFRDVLVGAPFAQEGALAPRGAAYLVLGPLTADMALSEASTRLLGLAPGDQYGWAVAGVGDLNHDGFDDVVVGAPLNNTNGLEAGAVYLFYGPLPPGSIEASQADATFLGGEGVGGRIGHTLVGMCDINGDGFSDFMISSFQSTASGSVGGAVWVIYGQGL